MTQLPDHRHGAYYVTVRNGRGAATGAHMLALGPFKRHSRALGLVTMLRLAISRADLDPYHAHAYGTCRAPLGSDLVDGCLNRAFHVASDLRLPLKPAQRINPAILDRLAQSR
jgi:hypothetical protein